MLCKSFYISCIVCHLECKVLLCDFHREQAWERWTSKKDNGVSHVRDIILAHMRQIARSRTEAMCTKALEALKKSKEWEDTPNFQKYFEKIWLKHKEVRKINLQCVHVFMAILLGCYLPQTSCVNKHVTALK